MARLTVTQFNTPEFFGKGGNIPGGYGDYQYEFYIINPAFNLSPENELWYSRAQRFIEHGSLVGLKILEFGCAYGSLVRRLRQLGVDAYGLDLSWPISQGIAIWPELQPYLIVADARDYLSSPDRKRNEWEVVLSRGFLDCFSDADLATMIPQLNYITKNKQVHVVDQSDDPEYYNRKSLAEWEALPFEAGTLILDE